MVGMGEALKRCSKCGVEKPATREFFYAGRPNKRKALQLDSRCKECVKAHSKAQRDAKLADPELADILRQREAARVRLRRENNPESTKAASQKYKQRYPDRLQKSAELYRQRHPRRVIESQRLYREAHRERRREDGRLCRAKYRQLHPDKVRASQQKNRAKRLAAPGEFSGADLKALFVKQQGCCYYCGSKIKKQKDKVTWHVDHYIPLSRGGTNDTSNLVIACQPCNSRKWNKMPWEWMPERFSPPNESQ